MNGMDLYFAARLAFLDRGDVRLRTIDDRMLAGVVVEARSSRAVVSGRVDDYELRSMPAWALDDFADTLRRAFDGWEARAPARSLDRIRGSARVA